MAELRASLTQAEFVEWSRYYARKAQNDRMAAGGDHTWSS